MRWRSIRGIWRTKFSPHDLAEAQRMADGRKAAAGANGAQHRYEGGAGTQPEADMAGAMGEMAVSDFTGYAINCDVGSTAPDSQVADVGPDLQVKCSWTEATTSPHLEVPRCGPASHRWVLCHRQGDVVRLIGWQYGHKVMLDELWNERLRRPAYWVPRVLLRDADDLRDEGRPKLFGPPSGMDTTEHIA
jgi:hypothetical protein